MASSARLGFSLRDGFSSGEFDSSNRLSLLHHVSIFSDVHRWKILTWPILDRLARSSVQRQKPTHHYRNGR